MVEITPWIPRWWSDW